jgi:pyruvyl transferase EpsO
MLVRDQKSYELFKKFSSHPVFLCPDSAFLLELNRVGKRSNEIIGLFRTDKEKVKSKIKVDIPTEDWLVDQRDISFVLGDLIVRIINKLDLQSGQTELFFRNFLASHRVKRGCRQISRGRALVTDRLHAHILACLMGLEHIVLDNSYGKISSFRDTWTHDFEGHIFASELSLVPGLLKKMS